MPTLRILYRNHPHRTIALATTEYVLVFRHAPSHIKTDPLNHTYQFHSGTFRCVVELLTHPSTDLRGYQLLGGGCGIIGLITLNQDVFICVVTSSSKAAAVRPEEAILRISNVDFCASPLFNRKSCG
jgi:hypothetical protein